MATVNKDFKIKSGLIVEGTTATVNGLDILTKKQADQDYIVSLIGGTATSANEANKVVKRDANGDFAAGTITANVTGDVTGDVTGQVSDISNHNTSSLSEGNQNLYFTNQRALDATAAAYDAAGTAATEAGLVAGDLTDHENATEAHGATGAVVGTTNTQDISNKRIIDTLYFTDGVTIANEGEIEVQSGSHVFNVQANYGDLNLKAVATDASVYVISDDADIVLAANGGSYIGSIAAENEIATKGYADGVAGDVASDLSTHEQATTGIHGVTGNIVGTTDTQTLSNKTLGSDLAAGGYKVSGLLNPSANQDAATKSYVDTAVADLINGAPELLDTLNELAQAIGDDEDFITTVTTSIGEKVAKAGDSMSGNLDFGGTSKVTSLAAPTNSGDAANKNYVDTEISTLDTAAQGYADDAETAANSYTDGRETAITTAYESYADTAGADAKAYADDLAGNYDAFGSASAAQTAAEGFATGLNNTTNDRIDDLTTSDIPEGSNLYFTDYAAKVSAVDLLTNATQNNIEITWSNPTGLVITAENGVADSDTDDLEEGSTNLYFTDERAVDALEAVVPNFTAVEVNSLAKEVAVTATVSTPSTATALTWDTAEYRTVKALVKFATPSHTEVSEVLLTLDGLDNIAITEYAMVGTNGSMGTITATVVAGEGRLNVTTLNNATVVFVKATLLV
jgi:hypothetical protein